VRIGSSSGLAINLPLKGQARPRRGLAWQADLAWRSPDSVKFAPRVDTAIFRDNCTVLFSLHSVTYCESYGNIFWEK